MNFATVRAELEALLTAHAHEAAALDASAMNVLLPVLEQVRGELNRDLSAWIAAGKGSDRYTPQAYRNSLLAIEGSLDAMRARLNPLLAGVLGDHDAIARRLANTHTGRELALMAQAGFSDILPDVPLRVAAGLVQSRNAPMQRYETSAARYTGNVARDIRRELAVGVVRGETLDQLVTRMQRIGGPAGAVAVRGIAGTAGTAGAVIEVIPEGLFRRYGYWAERIVRTELAHAYNEQLQDITNDLRATTYMTDLTRRWDASSDGRLCPRCQDMHGALADPKTDMFPNDAVGPPLHPNCFVAGTRVATPSGPRAIESFVVGDVVLGGLSGRPRMVMDVHCNPFDGELVIVHAGASVLRMTPNHPVLTSRGWVLAGELEPSDELIRHGAQTGVVGANGGAAPSHDGPTRGGETGAAFGALPGHADHVGGASTAGFNAERTQGLDHGGAAAPELPRDGEDGVLRDVQGLKLLGVDVGDVHARILLQVQRIGAIRRERFAGEVFNLSVMVDESYVAEGLVVHNCRCRAGLWRASWERFMDRGYTDPGS